MADAITTKNITSVDEVQSVDNTDKVFVNDNGSFKQISVSNLMKQAPSGVTEETDPTVSEWAKQPTKPSYTANEVGALPVGTKIPTKTSDLTNDSGYLTQIPEEYVTETELGQKGYVIEDDIPEKLPSPGTLTFTGAVNDTYDGSVNKTINIPTGGGTGGTTDYNDLSNKPQLNGVTLEGNKTLDQVGVLAKNQGASNSGKYLSVGSDGNVVPADAPSGGTVDPEQIKQAVNGYLEENPVSGMTAEQEQQLSQNTTDITDLKSEIGDLDRLETANSGDLVSAINEANQNSSGRLTDEIKQALLQIASKVAYVDTDGQSYYDNLLYSLYPEMDSRYSMYITVANEALKEGYIGDDGDFVSNQTNHLIDKLVKALPFCVANNGTLVTKFPDDSISLRSAYYDSNMSFLSRDYAQQPFKMIGDPSAIYQKVGWYDPTETFNVSYIILLNEVDKTLFTNSNVSIDTSGELSFESGFHATNLIRIPSGCDKYVLYSNTISVNKIAFYDSDKTFILREYVGLTNDNLSKYGDIPMNAVYYRMSKKATDTMYNAVMKET